MALQIKLGSPVEVNPAEDDLGRSRRGYHPDMTATEVWEVARGTWKLNADRALENSEVVVLSPDSTVVAVAALQGVSRDKDWGGRRCIEGRLCPNDPRIGQPSPHPHPSRNPIAYV